MGASDYVKNIRSRIGHDLLMLPGVSALIFNEANEVLLQKRTESGRWGCIGGAVDPGESVADGLKREVREEMGIEIAIDRVTGIYATPAFAYKNGDNVQYVTTAFRCRIVSGEPHVADEESIEFRFFPLDALPPDVSETHLRRIRDAAEPGTHQPAKFA